MSEQCSQKLQDTLNPQLTNTLGRHIPKQVDIEAPKDIAMKVAADLG